MKPHLRSVRTVSGLVLLIFPVLLFAAPGDLVLTRKEGSASPEMTPPSIFPHWVHRINYRCDSCHDRLFKMELGATKITMDLMNEGGSCATCHNGEMAFGVSFQSCNRCHRADGSGKKE